MTIKEQLQQKIDNKTKPVGSLGRLEKIALQIGEIQNSLTPEISRPVMLVFAADHGLADEGVSPFPKEVTSQMVLNFLNGGAAINVFCRQNNIILKVVDAGVDFDFEENNDLINAKIKRGTNNILQKPAMSSDECKRALAKGKELIEELLEKGSNTIGFGEMGIGNTSSASLLMHKICNIPIDECVGRGTGHNNEGLLKKKKVLQQVSNKFDHKDTPIEILTTFGGLEIAMMTGAMLRAAEKNFVLLIDGFIATSAILVAHALNKDILKNCIFCHQSGEQGHKRMLEYLGVDALLNLEMRLGEGSGAAIALPVVQAAVNFINEMASFESAGVSNKEQ